MKNNSATQSKNTQSKKKNNPTIDDTSLFRYALWADMLRVQFEKSLARDRQEFKKRLQTKQIVFDRKLLESEMYMCLWFGVLYVVIEGWPELKLNEPEITALLRSRFKGVLRNFRNATFHPENFDDARISALVKTGQASIDWARKLTIEFNSFFESRLLSKVNAA